MSVTPNDTAEWLATAETHIEEQAETNREALGENRVLVLKFFQNLKTRAENTSLEECGQYPGSWLSTLYFMMGYKDLAVILGHIQSMLNWDEIHIGSVTGVNMMEDFFEAVMIHLLLAYGVLGLDENKYYMKDIGGIDRIVQIYEAHNGGDYDRFEEMTNDLYRDPKQA